MRALAAEPAVGSGERDIRPAQGKVRRSAVLRRRVSRERLCFNAGGTASDWIVYLGYGALGGCGLAARRSAIAYAPVVEEP